MGEGLACGFVTAYLKILNEALGAKTEKSNAVMEKRYSGQSKNVRYKRENRD